MFTSLIRLELAFLDELSREQLIAVLLAHRDYLTLDFSDQWLRAQPMDQLRLLVLAAKLLHVLRQKETVQKAASGWSDRG